MTALSVFLGELKLVPPPAPGDRFARACAAGDLTTVTEALRANPDLGPLDDTGLTPLHLAALSRCPEVVTALLAAGADPNVADRFGTPLTDVARENETVAHQVVALLLGAGADPNPAGGDVTPLTAALTRGSDTAVILLLDAGADPHRCAPVTRHGVRGLTATHQAVLCRPDALRAVLDKTTNVDVRTPAGITPLHYAIAIPSHDDPAVVSLLIAAGADVDARLDDPSQLKAGLVADTPLGVARELGKRSIASRLESAGAAGGPTRRG